MLSKPAQISTLIKFYLGRAGFCILLLLLQQHIFANTKRVARSPNSTLNTLNLCIRDTFPATLDSTVIIPFEHKQSTLNNSYTYRLMDSVADILNGDTAIHFSVLGYSHFDEGNNYVCYWLSHDRADAVKSYLFGRGADSLRMRTIKAMSKARSLTTGFQAEPVYYNHTAEVVLHYPIPPPPMHINDMDGDGIEDKKDSCASEYGYPEMNGCPDREAILVPFEEGHSAIIGAGYKVMDSVVSLLRKDLSLMLIIDGHAYPTEGIQSFCERIAIERADIVKRYLLTRQIDSSRFVSIKSMGTSRPLNAGKNPRDIARNCRAELHLIHKN